MADTPVHQPERKLGSATSLEECGVRLNTGTWMPAPAFGTWNITGSTGQQALTQAIGSGYRHIDTAHMYRNEKDIGQVLRARGDAQPRPFITTKFTGHGYEHAKAECARALLDLGVDTLDMMLIHWPGDGDPAKRSETWRALEEMHELGKCRAIGVSNFTERHLRQLLAHARIVPAVNQIEFHPQLVQADLVAFCHGLGIEVSAYMPFGSGELVAHEQIAPIAARLERTVPQVILRWHLQHGVVPIPKSGNAERMAENTRLFDFELSEEEMRLIDSLHRDLHYDWDPTDVK